MQLPATSQRRNCLQSVEPSGAFPGVGGGGVEAETTGLSTGGGGGMLSSTESQTAPLLQSSPDASHSHSHLQSPEAPKGQIMAQRMSATRIFRGRRTSVELVLTFVLLPVRFFFIFLPPRSDSVVSFRNSWFRQIATGMPTPRDSNLESPEAMIHI